MRTTIAFILSISLVCCKNKNAEIAGPPVSKFTWEMNGFRKVDSLNPILSPDSGSLFSCPVSWKSVHWEERNVLNPSAIVKDGKVFLLYRAQDNAMCSRLGLAMSDDGLHFTREPEPVFYPAQDSLNKYEWNGGVEDPRLIETPNGEYLLTYTSYDGKLARLCMAISTDLRNWKKYGPIFKEEKYKNSWSKSGAIICERKDDKMVAVKINGKYWMYFGDTDLFIASSDDLITWSIAEDKENGKMISVMHPRKGYFDSRLVEPGPYAIQKKEGILLIYTGSNAANYNDSAFPVFTYGAGQALFASDEPYKLIARTDSSFIYPDKPYEKAGEVNEVCFVEGLVHFQNKWFLYYGTADSKIAVARTD